MADSKNSAEIVTDKDLDPVLKNKTFDRTVFLRLYSDWKVTNDTHLFASLRKMHEDAGYNNRNIVFGAEQEMHEIAAIVQKYQDGKNTVATNTTNATASAASTVNSTVTTPVASLPATSALSLGETIVYPERQKAFADALTKATTFPFVVRYTESGKSYETMVSVNRDTILVGSKAFKLHDFLSTISSVGLDASNVVINGSTTISKTSFVQYIGENLSKPAGTYSIGSGLTGGRVTIAGEINPKEIIAQKETLDTGLIAKVKILKSELEKRFTEDMNAVDLIEGLKYFKENVQDPTTRQMTINFMMNRMSRDFAMQLLKDGTINVTATNPARQGEVASFENALNTSLKATYITRAELETSLVMMTGAKWSEYARSLAKSDQASTEGYAKFLATDTYNIDLRNKSAAIAQIKSHTTMKAQEKAFLLSYLDDQMKTMNTAEVTGNYLQSEKEYQELYGSTLFTAINKVTGGAPMTPAQAQAAAEAAARGSSEGGDGKGATWALGILAAIVGLGFKKGEGWSLWTSLKRIFMGGLAVGGVMLGCAAGREWKKELGMDVCEEAKKALKDGIKDLKDGMKGDGTSNNTATSALAQQAGGPAAQAAVGPTLTTTQDAAKKKVEGMDDLKTKISALSGSQKNAPLEKYVDFARSLESQKLSVLVIPTNPDNSIFSQKPNLDPSISVPGDIDVDNLKRVIRAYLTGVDIPYSELKDNNATWNDYSSKYDTNKTLLDAVQITYGTNNVLQNTNNVVVDVNHIKSYTIAGITIDATQTNIMQNGSNFNATYSVTAIGSTALNPAQKIQLTFDDKGNLTTKIVRVSLSQTIVKKLDISQNGTNIQFS